MADTYEENVAGVGEEELEGMGPGEDEYDAE